jgi:hypothetical protein
VTMMAGGGITVNNAIIEASGGSGYGSFGISQGQGGAATIVLNATGGSIQMEGAEGAAMGGGGATGGNAVVALYSAAGNITVQNKYYSGLWAEAVNGSTPGSAALILAAAGNVTLIDGASLYTSGDLGIAGANVSLDNAYASASGSLVVGATGNLDVLNGSSLTGGGNATLGVGGNVTVDSSNIYGNPEVVMSVGGVINMSNSGTIEAGSPSTIFLTFPMLASGGYFVNGVEGVVYDSGTGFVVLGNPAILGTNLHVLYGGGGQLDIPTDALIVAMGQSTTPPDPERDKNVFEDLKKDKEKEAPVCR